MKVVIFGGSGFLGSHIADALTDRGHEVVVFDINKSPYIRPGQTMVVGNILDAGHVEEVTNGCDVVYNLAGIADIDECVSGPVESIKNNILGNAVALESARKAGVKRFVFASSVYVYSQSGSFYRSSKQACESFIDNYYSIYGLPYTILRYGSLYGDRAGKNNGIYKLLKETIEKGKIQHPGDGEEVREYIHVRDAAELSVNILAEEYENEHIILTGNQSLKYKDLLEMIREIFGNRFEIEYLDRRRTGHYKITPYSFNPRIGRKLVKNPFVDMGQGLLNCIADIYEELHQEKKEEMGLFVESDDESE